MILLFNSQIHFYKMKDTCLVCLEKRILYPINCCNVNLCKKCLNNELFLYCPYCKNVIDKPLNNTQIEEIINAILNQIEDNPNIVLELRHKLFKFLCKCDGYMKNNKKFSSIVKNKLVQLYIEGDWEPASDYHHKIYGNSIKRLRNGRSSVYYISHHVCEECQNHYGE